MQSRNHRGEISTMTNNYKDKINLLDSIAMVLAIVYLLLRPDNTIMDMIMFTGFILYAIIRSI